MLRLQRKDKSADVLTVRKVGLQNILDEENLDIIFRNEWLGMVMTMKM